MTEREIRDRIERLWTEYAYFERIGWLFAYIDELEREMQSLYTELERCP